jgi:hypothetical protein
MMSLNFNTTAVVNKDVLTVTGKHGDEWSPVTQSLVFGAVYCGLSEITEANVTQWWERMSLLQLVTGPVTAPLYAVWAPVMVTEQDIRNHIGLKTNASRKSDTGFLRSVYGWHRDGLALKADRTASATV